MIRLLLFCFSFLLTSGISTHSLAWQDESPVAVILDTDMDSDVDDVGALAMLHAYERQKKATILGIIVTSDDKYSASCTDAINVWFGRKDIPIGVSQKDSLREFSKYTRQISGQFPNRFKSNAEAEDGTTVYRRLLSNAPDQSVVIVTIGHLTSLSKLLDSAPDSNSPLSGRDLVRKKVKRWSCMGGQFPEGKEANFYRPDPASTINCLTKWKLPVTFAGWEVGNQIVTGGASFKAHSDPKSPVYKAYALYNGFQGRASWDQIALLEAVEGAETYFTVKKDGHCKVAPDGSNKWIAPADDSQGYLVICAPVEKIRGQVDRLMLGK
ncbi:nucleoside hydrolase [Dyadobacter aurulentus]|uniref:nucleoside hydrolase n=1 Tax=Dyadobacter sp. UC 10 TaxID=2605428 RepID=UPI0011F0BA20|nr:nucleoside hydrolase [Dyadobacter sp. UC 10]KAA0991962.1 nucleoside hydrolase [Dyadobacter sp. UC 10]